MQLPLLPPRPPVTTWQRLGLAMLGDGDPSSVLRAVGAVEAIADAEPSAGSPVTLDCGCRGVYGGPAGAWHLAWFRCAEHNRMRGKR